MMEGKMKILHISDNMIFGYGGGSLEERKIFDGLKQYSSLNGAELRTVTIDPPFAESLIPLQIEKSRRDDYASRLIGHSSYMYFVWKRVKKKVLAFRPDVVVLGRTRLGFIAKDIRHLLPEAVIVCDVDNVEYDYVDGYFSGKKSFSRLMSVWLEKKCTYRDELMAFRYSDAVFYLTERDMVRAHEVYDFKVPCEEIIPICIEEGKKLRKLREKKDVVFIGSLGYDSNSSAVTSFINDVWKPFFEKNGDVELVIGGSNPGSDLENLINSIPNAILVKDFADITDVVSSASLMTAPIRQGAGMKVKVAESLSLGLIVAASDEALVGYEEALNDSPGKSIFKANTTEEYVGAIEGFIGMSEQDLSSCSGNSIRLFNRYYDYGRSRRQISEVLERAIKMKHGRKG